MACVLFVIAVRAATPLPSRGVAAPSFAEVLHPPWGGWGGPVYKKVSQKFASIGKKHYFCKNFHFSIT